MGIQGSGKGTQAKRTASKYGLTHISTGELFREEYQRKTELGMHAHSYWGNGGLVPDDVTIKLLDSRLPKERGAVIEGFPRTIPQAQALDDIVNVGAVMELRLEKEVCIYRMEHRRICLPCNQEYGLARIPKEPEKCDNCHGQLTRREDDTPEKISKRFAKYESETMPVIKFYQPRGIVAKINADQKPDEVFLEVQRWLDQGMTRAYPAIRPDAQR